MAMFKRLIDAVPLGSERPLRRLIAYYAILVAALGILLFLYPPANALLMSARSRRPSRRSSCRTA